MSTAFPFPVTITSVTMCCGAHRSRSRGISFLPCPYFYSALRASFGKLRFPTKSRCPSGNVLDNNKLQYGERWRTKRAQRSRSRNTAHGTRRKLGSNWILKGCIGQIYRSKSRGYVFYKITCTKDNSCVQM